MEEQRQREIEEKLARYDELERKHASELNNFATAANAMHGLQDLIKQGFIKVHQDGTVEPILEEADRNQLQNDIAQSQDSAGAVGQIVEGVNTKYDGLLFPGPMRYVPDPERARASNQLEPHDPVPHPELINLTHQLHQEAQ